MVTAKEAQLVVRDRAACERALNAYWDHMDNRNRPASQREDLRKKYGVGHVRLRELILRGKGLASTKHHWTCGLLTAEELKELNEIKDWIEFLSDNMDTPKSE